MLDSITSLAFSMHSARGVYALLLGSGISRTARIPTGWEITLELVRKLAALEGEDCGNDPAAWYRTRFHAEPDYAQLLDAIAKMPAERQQLLRSYWEPSDAEREEGAKQPTAAHRAIADLVKSGYVRVILTTNFDRLLEIALQDAGIQPTVLSTPDHIDGAMPLMHNSCTVVKVNGDYLDTRIRNTPTELSAYPDQTNRLLDRVFDEFGLIVCGWSADWDEALRTAIARAPYRRFSTYWAARGDPSDAAEALIRHRGAHVVPIDDADSFFSQLNEKVQALEDFNRPHPLSTEAAIASLKKYLSEPRYRIQLDDLVRREVARVLEACPAARFPVNDQDVSPEAITRRVKAYEAACETLMNLAFVAGRWSDTEQATAWSEALRSLAQETVNGGVVFWLDLQRYPATLLLYAFGLGAVAARNYAALATVLATKTHRDHQDDQRAIERCVPAKLSRQGSQAFQALPGMERRFAPLSDWLHELLKPVVQRELHQLNSYTLLFDRLEILFALAHAAGDPRAAERFWAPPGAFGYRNDNRQRILADMRSSIAGQGLSSPLVACGAFGTTSEQSEQLVVGLEQFVGRLNWW